MKVGQPYNHITIQRPLQPKVSSNDFENNLQKSETMGKSLHEKLEQALDDKSWLTEQIQSGRSALEELGKHLDLRV